MNEGKNNKGKKKIIAAALALAFTVAGYYGLVVPEQLAPAIVELTCTFVDC